MVETLTSYHSLERQSLEPVELGSEAMSNVVVAGLRLYIHPIPALPALCLMATETYKQLAYLLGTLTYELVNRDQRQSAQVVNRFASA